MKNCLRLLICLSLSLPVSSGQAVSLVPPGELLAQNDMVPDRTDPSVETSYQEDEELAVVDRTPAQNGKSKKNGFFRPQPRTSVNNLTDQEAKELATALDMAKNGSYREASTRLYKLSRDPRFNGQAMQIKYILGLMLYEMRFYQAAAYQFVDVIRVGDNKYMRGALEKLAMAADALNDDTLLNYALSRIRLEEFPTKQRDMLLFRIGEYQYRSGLHQKAIASFRAVPRNSSFYGQAKYLEALAFAEKNDTNSALKAYASLVRARRGASVTDKNRVAGLMGLARVYYQKKNWERSIEFYRRVPRDSEMWHEALFEMSWAQMRSSRFRAVLSNFHSLHSPYYEDFYLPESVLLRSIVYLYICQYDEMEKTIGLFDRVYSPVLRNLATFIRNNKLDLKKYYASVETVIAQYEELKVNREMRERLPIPFLVARRVLKEGDVQRNQKYINRLKEEMQTLQLEPSSWRTSPIGDFVRRALASRLAAGKERAGRLIRNHMIEVYKDLRELSEQNGFAKYELLTSKKEALKKKMAGKGLVGKAGEQDSSRSYYIQNGYEYWPFSGEYWLDEIGNYFYLGNQSCE
ncbi:MAG: tetratricopeptide repeat protein [Bdellovibrionales bacterium]